MLLCGLSDDNVLKGLENLLRAGKMQLLTSIRIIVFDFIWAQYH